MIKLNVSAANITVEEKETLTEGRVGLLCQFHFTDEWTGLAKTAVFDGADSRDVILKSDTVAIPAECLSAEGYSLSVGVYGKNAAGDIVIPTVYATVGKIQRSAYPSGREPAAPTPDVVAQIQQTAANAEELARSVREDADLGRFQGATGQKGDKGDKGDKGPQGEKGDAAPIDKTLTQEGQAADSKAVGDAIRSLSEEIANLNTDGISATARNLLITILRNGVYSSDQKANITDLETALGGSDAPVVKSYAITNTLTNCTTNNAVTSVTDGDSYTATLTAADGYALNSVVVTMGGTDITSTAYSGSVITIASVTGDVSIVATAVAAESGGGETVVNLFDKSTMVVSGAFVGANGAISTSATSKYAKIPISVGTYALQKGSGWAMSTTGHPSLIDSAGNVLCKFGNLQANGNAGSPSDASIGTIAKANGNAGIAVTVLSEAVTHIIFSICVNGGTDDTDTTMMEVGDTCHDYVAHV